MTTHPDRPLLPLLPSGRHGSRSDMTCHYRCGNACDHPQPNQSANEAMRDLVERSIARRSMLQDDRGRRGRPRARACLHHRVRRRSAKAARGGCRRSATSASSPVAPNNRDSVTVPKGFGHHVIISWGDRVVPGAPRFNVHDQTPEAAALQFGYNCDYIGVLPLSRTRALLVVNHEYTNEELMFPAGAYDADTIHRIAMASHGMSVVEIKRDTRTSGAWRRVTVSRTRYNRRVTMSTPMRVTGPAAGHPRLRTSADPSGRTVLGTLNNCAGGMTPWGTVLTGEENFNAYFEASGAIDARYAESYARYGITGAPRPQLEGHRPSLRPVEGAPRAVPVRLGRRARPVPSRLPAPEADDAGSVQARGREHRCGPRPGAWPPTWATTSAVTTSTSSSPATA